MPGALSDRPALWWLVVASLLLISLIGCAGRTPEVIVYTSVDQLHSEPVLEAFEEETGIRVRAVYDTEATKTTGLVSRLAAEREQPQADVFWSSEIAQTLWLQDEGILAAYHSPTAGDIPDAYKDPEGYWTGVGLRARILLVNTDLLPQERWPDSVFGLLDPAWQPGETGLANPLFGTTATHAAALYAALGPEEARVYFEALRDSGARVVDGNSVVRDMVANGDLLAGLTDTDDAHPALRAGKPVRVIYPDQDSLGTLLIPNTVALVAGGPNREEGQALIDFLLSSEVEKMLGEAGFFFASIRTVGNESPILDMVVDWNQVAEQMEAAKADMREIFLR